MGFRCGIVGLPNVGKSTIFNALTSAKVEAANYPFCTIEPNTGVVTVPDPRLKILADMAGSQKIIPTTIEFVDIAGLVKGASEGQGLGNQFLAHIREVDAIVHVVRCFEDDDVVHVDGSLSPSRDVEVIELELLLSDLASCERRIERVQRAAKSGDKQKRQELDLLEKAKSHLEKGLWLNSLDLSETEQMPQGFVTSKPQIFMANVAEIHAKEAPIPSAPGLLGEFATYAASRSIDVVVVSGALESEISELDEQERHEFLADVGLSTSGLERLAMAGYRLLNLITFFTVGPKEARAWTAQKDTCAPQAAGKIHTDFERGFIRAEVISYDDYVSSKGEAGARERGLLRVEGKSYVVEDGDVVHFRFNV